MIYIFNALLFTNFLTFQMLTDKTPEEAMAALERLVQQERVSSSVRGRENVVFASSSGPAAGSATTAAVPATAATPASAATASEVSSFFAGFSRRSCG